MIFFVGSRKRSSLSEFLTNFVVPAAFLRLPGKSLTVRRCDIGDGSPCHKSVTERTVPVVTPSHTGANERKDPFAEKSFFTEKSHWKRDAAGAPGRLLFQRLCR